MRRFPINLFVSYARADERIAGKLMQLLRLQTAPSRSFKFEIWDDRTILVGEIWEEKIRTAIAACDFGLLLISPAFLGSTFITEDELPHFVGPEAKPAIPVEIEAVNLATHQLHGLEQQQLFRLDREKPFADCDGRGQKRFAAQLYDQIERRLERLAVERRTIVPIVS